MKPRTVLIAALNVTSLFASLELDFFLVDSAYKHKTVSFINKFYINIKFI